MAKLLCRALKSSVKVTIGSIVVILQVRQIIHTRQKDPFVIFLPQFILWQKGFLYKLSLLSRSLKLAVMVMQTSRELWNY